jgi:hypothetical protein
VWLWESVLAYVDGDGAVGRVGGSMSVQRQRTEGVPQRLSLAWAHIVTLSPYQGGRPHLTYTQSA